MIRATARFLIKLLETLKIEIVNNSIRTLLHHFL